MLNPSPRLRRLEAEDERACWNARSFEVTLTRYAALWAHARRINPDLGADWADDLAADFAVARAVNGLPASS